MPNRRSSDDYATQLRALLPQGKAWPPDVAARLHDLLAAVADEFERFDDFVCALVDEADPRSTTDLVAEWERALGLPDPCVGPLDTIQERRDFIVQRFTDPGGQRAVDLIEDAAQVGFTITIDEGFPEFGPFRAGESTVGDAVGSQVQGNEWQFVFRVNVAEAITLTPFRAGESTVPEPLLTFGNAKLECVIDKKKPAHTIALYVYGGP